MDVQFFLFRPHEKCHKYKGDLLVFEVLFTRIIMET